MKRVVVTGVGAVSPIGNSAAEMFEAMLNGKSGIDAVTKFDTANLKCKVAAEVKDFDPGVIVPKNERRRTHLYVQYALKAAHEAFLDSKLEGCVDPERLGVYVGTGIGGITALIEEHAKYLSGGRLSPFLVPMLIPNMATGIIAMKFNARGENLPVTTACATSTHAIGEAYRAVKHGYADAVIAGGSEAGIDGVALNAFVACMALSLSENKDEASLPFDKRRNGFVMGEGAGIMIIEEYEHAKNRGAKIYAEIAGYGNTNDAYHITAPRPDGSGSANAILKAIESAEIKDFSKVYFNAHGTGTQLNDKTETLAIKNAFGDNAYKLNVSSTKSMTGHMMGAAGAIEAIASVLALQANMVPPTINYKEKDEDCDLNITPNFAVKAPLEYAVSNSLGFGGHNGCIAFKKSE